MIDDTYKLVDGKKECKETTFGQMCLRWVGLGCEACALGVFAVAGGLMIIWGLMYILS